ncbi:MAG: tetratricopeptide repeat protein [Thermoanaerobaculia bacterium]
MLMLALVAGTSAEAARKKKKDAAVFAGIVTNQGGETLEGVRISVAATGAEGFAEEVTTDKKGGFELTIPVAAGEVRVRLAKAGYAAFETTFEFLAGEQKNITFTLLDEATGRKQDAINAYNAGADVFNTGDRQGGIDKFLRAVELDPELAEAHLALADIYLDDGDHDRAAFHAETYLALKPGDQKTQLIAYEAYRKLGNQAKLEEYRAILAESGMSSQLAIQVFNEGAKATQEGDWERAIEKFNDALGLDPKLTKAYAVLAQIHYSRESFEEALAAVDKLLEMEPENADGRRYRFLVHDARGDAAAQEALDAWVEVDPQRASDILYQKADLDFRAGNSGAARRALLKVIELQPELARAHYTLGKVYASTDTAKAKEHLLKFIALAPDDPEVASAKKMLSYF